MVATAEAVAGGGGGGSAGKPVPRTSLAEAAVACTTIDGPLMCEHSAVCYETPGGETNNSNLMPADAAGGDCSGVLRNLRLVALIFVEEAQRL